MAMNDYLKEKLKSFARDNLGVKSWKEQVDENFANGEEVALMKGFTRAAQNQFIKDLVKKAVDTAKPKKLMPGNKVDHYLLPTDKINYYHHDATNRNLSPREYDSYMESFNNGSSPIWFRNSDGSPLHFDPNEFRAVKMQHPVKPKEYDKLVKEGKIDPNNPEIEPVIAWQKKGKYRVPVQNSLTPKQTAPEASAELEKAIMTMPENIQDAYLYGQRNLDDYSHLRKKGEMNDIYAGASQYNAGGSLPLGWDEHTIHIEPGEDIEPFVNDVLHEGGHRGDAGTIGEGKYSVERNLGRYLRKDIVDEIANSDNPRQMIEELSGGNKAIKRLLADAVGMHPEVRSPGNLQYRHKKKYAEDWRDTYNTDLPADLMNREEAVSNGPISAEGFAEIMGILGTEGGYEWMQKNAPTALRRFERINEVAKINAERALGPDGAVPERYNVNFHPELGD